MRFNTIKFVGGIVAMKWQTAAEDWEGGGWDKNSIEKKATPREAFISCLEKLKPFLVSICEIESLEKRLIKVTGVHIKYVGEFNTPHICITGNRTFKNSAGSDSHSTPYKPVISADEDGAPENILPRKCAEIIQDLIAEAGYFLNGERLQIDLFEVPEKKDESDQPNLLSDAGEIESKESDVSIPKKKSKKKKA